MARTVRCPCGEVYGSATARNRCRACGRVLVRPTPWGRYAVVLGLAAAAATVAGIAAGAWAKRPAHPAVPVAVAAAPAPPPVRAADPPPLVVPPPAPPALPPAEPDPEPTPAVVAPPPPAPLPPRRLEPELVARYRVGEAFDQEVTVSRRSAVRVAGAGVPQAADYTFRSRFTVEKVERDGGLVVRQRVDDARLGDSDPATRDLLADALKKAKGAAFEITVAADGSVVALKGPADPVRVDAAADPFGGQTLRAWSLLDADGWKELAGLTFFQPARPPAAGETWTRPLFHDWGALGGWSGRTRYTAIGRRDGAERIEYVHDLRYRPPAGGGGPLPVARADFRPVAAGGVIRYDAARGRVVAAEERFHVRGAVVVALAGVEATAEVEEVQGFRLRVLEPGARVLDAAGR